MRSASLLMPSNGPNCGKCFNKCHYCYCFIASLWVFLLVTLVKCSHCSSWSRCPVAATSRIVWTYWIAPFALIDSTVATPLSNYLSLLVKAFHFFCCCTVQTSFFVPIYCIVQILFSWDIDLQYRVARFKSIGSASSPSSCCTCTRSNWT